MKNVALRHDKKTYLVYIKKKKIDHRPRYT